jgi:hypothetical protein
MRDSKEPRGSVRYTTEEWPSFVSGIKAGEFDDFGYVFRLACDGRYEPGTGRPARLIIADATVWPGTPLAAWPTAQPGTTAAFSPAQGRGIQTTQRLLFNPVGSGSGRVIQKLISQIPPVDQGGSCMSEGRLHKIRRGFAEDASQRDEPPGPRAAVSPRQARSTRRRGRATGRRLWPTAV